MEHKMQVKNATLRTVLLMSVSLLCSLLLWVYVTDTQGEDISKTFPTVKVVFDGESALRESQGLIVSDISANAVRVRLTGNRRTISDLEASDLTASIDLSRITRTGNYSDTPVIRYPTRTDSSAITAAVVSPANIRYYVDTLDKKTMEVVGAFNGSVAEGFSAEPLEFSPENVIIYGPERVLEQVAKVQVEVNRMDVDKTLTFESTYVLLDAEGNVFESEELTFNTDTVSVTLPVSAVKDVALTVDLVAGGGVTAEHMSDYVKYRLEPDFITLTGDPDALSGVNSISVARIDLSTVEEKLTDSYRIVIPNGTEILSGVSETTLTLEVSGLYTQDFNISRGNISCTNNSEGYTAVVVNDSLNGVMIRGPEAAVKAIDPVNVRAVANLTDYGTLTGIVSVPVRIEVDGSTEVGAVGEYWVYVKITEGVDETPAPSPEMDLEGDGAEEAVTSMGEEMTG